MPDQSPKANLVSRLQPGFDPAAEEMDSQYRARLCQLVEREMNRRFRRKEDPEDVVQSAFRTFYRRAALGEFHIDSSADLWHLLAAITRRKVLKHVEMLGAGKRDPKREEHVEGDVVLGRIPTPEEASIAADLIENALTGLDETYIAVFDLRLQTHTEVEIAAKLRCTRAMVRNKLSEIRDRLERLSLRKSAEDDWQPAELAEMLRNCLKKRVSEYLEIDMLPDRSTGPKADAPSEQAALSAPMEDLLRAASPPLGLLIAVKRRARRLMSPGASSIPAEIHRFLYFGSIAAALLHHGERISKSTPDVLRCGVRQAAAEPWIEDWGRGLFADALQRLAPS